MEFNKSYTTGMSMWQDHGAENKNDLDFLYFNWQTYWSDFYWSSDNYVCKNEQFSWSIWTKKPDL